MLTVFGYQRKSEGERWRFSRDSEGYGLGGCREVEGVVVPEEDVDYVWAYMDKGVEDLTQKCEKNSKLWLAVATLALVPHT
ncbi:unnamed protein product [Eruca vesicaria subsp. sativa]|uniref:Uncharacterized protein n=1 Tax=Eruca vesicaria subsp. sativa TaxID=29727 RepID=A0ABC8L836_ERUVS|nr:unnamed protein product [Eruca vesicaria subsp. sativa]